MFRSAILKLTGLYLLIIMAISLFFSLNLYRISDQEISNSLRRLQGAYERIGGPRGFMDDPEILQERELQLISARQRLILRLFYTNMFILVLGGVFSYLLAKKTLEPIEESHKSQIRFTADASHELRSPLAAMQSEIEVALRDPKLSKEEAVKLLKSNLEEVERLKVLSNGLLELARDNGDSLPREKILVKDFIESGVRNVRESAKKKNIIIETDLTQELFVFGNKDSLVELATILLDNAIKYSESGKKIRASFQKHSKFVEIFFKDEGFGISEKDLPHVFDRFYRVDNSRSRKHVEGYGLGLSIAKKIVEANYGKIEVYSEIGKSSTFTVKLPTGKT